VINTDKARVGTILNIALQITANLVIITEPFLPFSAGKIAGFLRLEKTDWNEAGGSDLLPQGHTLGEPSLLFEKIEDETMELQIQKLHQSKALNQAVKKPVNSQKPNVTYDEFSRMDIRIGLITEAEKVPKTKKLMKLTIDTGMDIRTVVSGISEFFEPEDVIGKQVCLLANLEPRDIKGIQSQGMILLAEDAGGKLVFVTPEESMDGGAEVK
jgi:methionyl-tRNA synthetase